MPSCLMTSRRTSATVTLSMTWSRPRTVMPLTTLVPSPTSREARSKACCDSAALAARAGQHDAVADAFDADVGVRHRLLERGAHAVEVARDRDVEAGDLLAVGVEEKDVGLPDGDADHVDAARRADHRVGDLGIGDQHVLDVGRQVDGDRLADAERNEARGRLARRHLDHRHVPRVGRRHRGGRRQACACDECRQRGGADQVSCVAMSPFPLTRSFRCRHRADAKTDDVHARCGACPISLRLAARPASRR